MSKISDNTFESMLKEACQEASDREMEEFNALIAESKLKKKRRRRILYTGITAACIAVSTCILLKRSGNVLKKSEVITENDRSEANTDSDIYSAKTVSIEYTLNNWHISLTSGEDIKELWLANGNTNIVINKEFTTSYSAVISPEAVYNSNGYYLYNFGENELTVVSDGSIYTIHSENIEIETVIDIVDDAITLLS